MVLLTLLRILLVLTIIAFPVVFSLKKPNEKILYIPYYLGFAYEIVMLFDHPLMGFISLGTAFILLKYFILTSNDENFKFRFERLALYSVLFVFSCSIIFEVIETIVGRLF